MVIRFRSGRKNNAKTIHLHLKLKNNHDHHRKNQNPSTKYATSAPATSTKHTISTLAPSTNHATSTVTLPSISPLSTPRLFSRSHSEIRELTLPLSSLVTITRKRTKSAANEVQQAFNVFYFCADTLQSPNIDYQF